MTPKKINSAKTICTHNGKFHADEVFASAIIKLINPSIEIIRTRDIEILNNSDFRIDVGKKHNPETGDFDHHQIEFTKKRENQIPYSAAGLIWKNYAKELSLDDEAIESIDEKLISQIDANDNGITLFQNENKNKPYDISTIINAMNPSWADENQDYDKAFHQAVDFAMSLLQREITSAQNKAKAKDLVLKYLETYKDKKYVVFDEFLPWKKTVTEESEKLFIIYPVNENDWRIQAVPVDKDSFENRKNLPAKWAGLESEELNKLTGINDAIFCHKNLFLCGTKSKESALKLLEIALNS